MLLGRMRLSILLRSLADFWQILDKLRQKIAEDRSRGLRQTFN